MTSPWAKLFIDARKKQIAAEVESDVHAYEVLKALRQVNEPVDFKPTTTVTIGPPAFPVK